MKKNGIILLIILLCLAFLVSCGRKKSQWEDQKGELVRYEAGEVISPA